MEPTTTEPTTTVEPAAPAAPAEPTSPPSAPAEPTTEPTSEAKPSFLDRFVSRIRGAEGRAAGDEVQEPEPWKAWTRDDYARYEQAILDRGEERGRQRTRSQQIADTKRELDAALTQNDAYEVTELTKRLRSLERDDSEALSADEELRQHGDRIVQRYDQETIEVWIDKLGLDKATVKGPRPKVSEQLLDAAMDYGAARAMDEIRDGTTPAAKSLRLELLHEFQGINADNEPVHIEGTPPASGSLSWDRYIRMSPEEAAKVPAAEIDRMTAARRGR